MGPKQEWEQFFDGHAPIYMKNVWTRNTVKEIDFILEELKLEPGTSILDIGCGTGRHSIELAKRGYKVTGVDISSGMLAEADKAAKEANVKVEWIHTNATQFKSKARFDGAICLCEGAFSLLSSGDQPIQFELAILRNIYAALKPRAKLILNAINGYAKARKVTQKDVEEGKFDPVSNTEAFTMDWDTPEGKKSVQVRERGYVPTELIMLFERVGFRVNHVWGGTAGKWGRRTIDLDEIELMVIAEKLERLPQ
jgi:cyclopropane fatty-acyl-phospholipid synthase-like methyltransferase